MRKPPVCIMTHVVDWRWDNEDADPSDRELVMKVIYDDGDSEELTESKLHGLVGVMAQLQKTAGGHHQTQHQRAVKNLAATQAVPGDNVDEGSSPEPPAKKAKQPAKPAAGVPARGRSGDRARAGGAALGSRPARRGRAAVAADAGTREQEAGRRVAIPAEIGCK
eukprot:jgi/Tetstr1/423366/TSEL_001371.t1